MARGIDAPVPTLEEAQAHRYSEPERTYVEQQRARLVHGDPAENTSSSSTPGTAFSTTCTVCSPEPTVSPMQQQIHAFAEKDAAYRAGTDLL